MHKNIKSLCCSSDINTILYSVTIQFKNVISIGQNGLILAISYGSPQIYINYNQFIHINNSSSTDKDF